MSVLQTRLQLSLENGFVSRIVDGSQDYGVDIYCELCIEGGPTSFIFPIQIKSTQKAKYVFKNGKKYFTLSFLTSRLGYLLRHLPGLGMVIFYNERDKTLYYDYVIEIYNRIRLEKEDDSWKNQKYVTIHIPDENVLEDDLNEIHKELQNSFSNAQKKFENINAGQNYKSINRKTDPKNVIKKSRVDQAIHYLETIGPYLFNERDYGKVTGLLDLLSLKHYKRPRVSYIAALVYTETGDYIEADFFLKLCASNKDAYSEEESVALEMQRFKVDYSYGKRTPNEFIATLKRIKERTTSKDNILNIDININMIELNQHIGQFEFDKGIVVKIEKILEKIDLTTQDDEQKYLQKVFQSENLIGALTRIYSDHMHNKHLLMDDVSVGAVNEWSIEYKNITTSFEKILYLLDESLNFAISKENQLLEAHALKAIAYGFFSMNLSLFIGKHASDKSKLKTILEGCLQQAVAAYNLFNHMDINQHAFEAITLAYNIYRLAEEWVDVKLDKIIPLSKINKRLSSFDQYEFGGHFESVIDKIINEHSTEARNLNEDELLILAERIIRVKNLPENRTTNLFNEFKAYKFFSNNCKREDLVLLSNQVYQRSLAYSQPSKYAVASKNTGVIFMDGYDIEEIMKHLGLVNE